MSDDEDPYGEEEYFKQNVSTNVILHMQKKRYGVFKAQDHENGHFDCSLDIDGKKLYCHKFVLATASETFNALLSDRWNKDGKDNVIKIDNPDYTYECFNEFLTFLYSGFCTVTNDNCHVLTDMAEYYGVDLLKQLCDISVSKMTITLENVEEMTEFIDKYSLETSLEKLKQYVNENIKEIIKAPILYGYRKSFLDVLSTIVELEKQPLFFDAACEWGRHHSIAKKEETKDENFDVYEYAKDLLDEVIANLDFYKMDYKFIRKSVVAKRVLFHPYYLYDIVANCKRFSEDEDNCFKLLYWLAEEEVKKKQKGTPEDGNTFDIEEAIRIELDDFLSDINFHFMTFKFLMEFVVEKGFDFPLVEVYKNLGHYKDSNRDESAFKRLYELVEKQALIKQKLLPDINFDLDNAIKNRISDVLPTVDFHKMSQQFLMEFIVGKGIITVEQAERVYDLYVEVENDGKTLVAIFKDNFKIHETVHYDIGLSNLFGSSSYLKKPSSWNKYYTRQRDFKVPTTPPSLMKMKGVDWYLCFEKDGSLYVKHRTVIDRNDFLIAEMRSKSKEEFVFNTEEPAEISTYYKNVCAS